MSTDALAHFVARSSANMVLDKQDKQVLAFHKEGVQLPISSQCWEMIENTCILLYFMR